MLKVVFDTVVLVRSLINPHNSCGRIVFSHFAGYRLFISEPVAREMLEVLHRPELSRKFRQLATMDLRQVIEILGQAEMVTVASVSPVSRDPKDDKFLATAAAAGADYLVSEDDDLLVLGEYQGVKIIRAEAFLRTLEGDVGD
ncbi:MAG: putative toxin-antitoxin system toxin component, PIN family [Chloroflexota bacterium]|nr:putative toxin-antitoxin system toxin component, PIN family [Chloroflexota bacterium]